MNEQKVIDYNIREINSISYIHEKSPKLLIGDSSNGYLVELRLKRQIQGKQSDLSNSITKVIQHIKQIDDL